MLTAISASNYEETLRRLLEAITHRGLTVFAQIDHAAAARDVDMELNDELLVIFGNPRAGTPLMQQDPRVGLELPLRVLVWDSGDAVMVGYNEPKDLAYSFELSPDAPTLQAMSSVVADVIREAVQ